MGKKGWKIEPQEASWDKMMKNRITRRRSNDVMIHHKFDHKVFSHTPPHHTTWWRVKGQSAKSSSVNMLIYTVWTTASAASASWDVKYEMPFFFLYL